MKAIEFQCTATLASRPEEIAGRILDLAAWPDFKGYGPLPGIKSAEFEAQLPGIVGTRIRVVNTDGSRHVEEIVEWQPDRCVRLEMSGFSPPLAYLAIAFSETWQFERVDDQTHVVRSFEIRPMNAVARPVLWLISILLKHAIARHLRQMRDAQLSAAGVSAR